MDDDPKVQPSGLGGKDASLSARWRSLKRWQQGVLLAFVVFIVLGLFINPGPSLLLLGGVAGFFLLAYLQRRDVRRRKLHR